jgi:oligosaccharide translocation protein RFT1
VLVRCIVTLAAVAAAFGPAYSHLALLLLYSKRWADTEAATALGLYSLHLPLLAANGILESFLHSVADQRQLHANNAALVGFTAAHAALSVAAVRTAGAAGLIGADAASMLLRIAYCLVFTQRRFAATVPGFSLRQLLPSRQTAAALGTALALTSAARVALLPASSTAVQFAQQHSISLVPPALAQQLAGQPFAVLAGCHVAVGVACLAMAAAAIARNERSIVAEVRQLRKAGKSS